MSFQKQTWDLDGGTLKNTEELWRPVTIEGLQHLYHVSNRGRVKALAKTVVYKDSRIYHYKEKIMFCRINDEGYRKAPLCFGKREFKHYAVHRLVALAFVDNYLNKPCVNHIDGKKLNNNVENLEWVTKKENNIHAIKTGLHPNNFMGSNNPHTKLNPFLVSLIRKSFDNGFTVQGISKTFDISIRQTERIIKYQQWKQVS